jgi:hypothetical protein
MDINLGKLVQKSSGPVCEHLVNPRLKCNLDLAKTATFAFWNACAVSAQNAREVKL